MTVKGGGGKCLCGWGWGWGGSFLQCQCDFVWLLLWFFWLMCCKPSFTSTSFPLFVQSEPESRERGSGSLLVGSCRDPLKEHRYCAPRWLCSGSLRVVWCMSFVFLTGSVAAPVKMWIKHAWHGLQNRPRYYLFCAFKCYFCIKIFTFINYFFTFHFAAHRARSWSVRHNRGNNISTFLVFSEYSDTVSY